MIQEVYQDLLEYDKQPLVFRPSNIISPIWERFSKRDGHINVDNIKRYAYYICKVHL